MKLFNIYLREEIKGKFYKRFLNRRYYMRGQKGEIISNYLEADYKDKITWEGKIFIDNDVYLQAYGGIHFGDDVSIAKGVKILTFRYNFFERNVKNLERKFIPEPVFIGNGVMLGYNAIILPGVKIGDKSIIGAGSVIGKNIPPSCIVSGNPGKIIDYIN